MQNSYVLHGSILLCKEDCFYELVLTISVFPKALQKLLWD